MQTTVSKFAILLFATLVVSTTLVYGENLNSTNYKLVDPELSTANGETQSTNYRTLVGGMGSVDYSRISSSLYKIGSGNAYTFMANVPKITCAETVSNGSNTTCLGLPTASGMEGSCGGGGCYDRAKVEIDTQSNPSDTLYAIEFTMDNWATSYVLDGSTHTLKPLSSKTINDYKTKASWENSPWNGYNILGLKPTTTYKVRVKALQGDFTESGPSPEKTFTTAVTYIGLDLNIATSDGVETNAPYAVAMNNMVPGGIATAATNIFAVLSTNSQSGASVYISGQYGGLRSSSTSHVIATTSTDDLANVTSGFGARVTQINATPASVYGVAADFGDTAPNKIGSVPTTAKLLFCTDIDSTHNCTSNTQTWVERLSMKIDLLAKPGFDAPAVSDYTENLTFTAISNW